MFNEGAGADAGAGSTRTVAEKEDEADEPQASPLIEEDLLVEDVSIDGMCGVY